MRNNIGINQCSQNHLPPGRTLHELLLQVSLGARQYTANCPALGSSCTCKIFPCNTMGDKCVETLGRNF